MPAALLLGLRLKRLNNFMPSTASPGPSFGCEDSCVQSNIYCTSGRSLCQQKGLTLTAVSLEDRNGITIVGKTF